MKFSFSKLFLRFIFVCFLINSSACCFAQDSSRMRISLLTCTPGDELYSIFGHSALRVIDSNSVTDIVYNYGTFNFDDEGFYLKFIRGKLLYYISIEDFTDFKFLYQATNRGITEQVLHFSGEEKETIRKSLIVNLQEKNKYYQYDFFLDNCTTRLRDLIIKNKNPTPFLPAVMPVNTRFREAIYEYLDKGHQYWSKLGIDVLLGARTDRIMTAGEQEFLPDNLMKALDQSSPKIVVSSANLYPLTLVPSDKAWFTPGLFFTMLLLFFVVLSLIRNPYIQTVLAGLDGLLFFLTGLLGFILIFMWTSTDHSMTKDNYNLLWALPTHLFASFFVTKRKSGFKKYFFFTSISLVLVSLVWFFLPQHMNTALLPFVLLLLYRSAMISLR